MSHTAKQLVMQVKISRFALFEQFSNFFLWQDEEKGKKPTYSLMGQNTCMGDHKVNSTVCFVQKDIFEVVVVSWL
jgi:hypothetical protein